MAGRGKRRLAAIDGLSPKAASVIRAFAARHPEFEQGAGAFDQCYAACRELHGALEEAGFDPTVVQVADPVFDKADADPRWLGIRDSRSWTHYVVTLDHLVIDPTIRQFSASAPTPDVFLYNDLKDRWRKGWVIENSDLRIGM